MIDSFLFAAAARRRVAAGTGGGGGDEGGGGTGGGGGGTTPTAPAAPSSLSVYDYSAGTRFGIQCALGDATASTEWYRDGILYSTKPAGVSSVDVGLKSGDGSHSWTARHLKSGLYSDYSAALNTLNGVEA